jgi:hypothetical protein
VSAPSLREQATAKLFSDLAAEIVPTVPAAMWARLTPFGPVDQADRALQIAANRFEDGQGSREEVAAAENHLRATWREAINRYKSFSTCNDRQAS